MKISVNQALKAFQESFVKKDSGPIGKLLSDDFVWYSAKGEDMSREETLEWAANYQGRISDFESFYENEEVLVGRFSCTADQDTPSPSSIMFIATLKGYGRISSFRIQRTLL